MRIHIDPAMRCDVGAYGGIIERHDGRLVRVEDVEAMGTEDGCIIVRAHELVRLMRDAQMLDYLRQRCTYLEDGRQGAQYAEHYWSADDDSRLSPEGRPMPLDAYIAARLDGTPIWTTPPDDEAHGLQDDNPVRFGAIFGGRAA